ncbi:sarcolemmal membrane-associated protein [Microplitis demolitor]|uniref:sarcolemmal membrane-associated protein n=1 Tax=Microplitis demolitor TaxID=69319 RepID=UPI0004CDD5BB|nr:sarcolemmal membrane-associated protein [Microplitis demolitor]
MVVASSGWIQNANFPSNQSDSNLNSDTAVDSNNKMTAKGILICRDNSHAFQDRTLNLDQPVKIGRSVARTRAANDNAIFDCKVLSRNHALLWYNAGKFFLQDTRSSNGTFVNNQRLSATGSESAAKEVCSGDIVQFGVDVVESTKKVTHGCIIATLKLYLPDGKEAKASRSMYMTSAAGDVTLEDLYKLNQYVQEASRREKVLQSKLAYLEKLVDNTKKAASQSWKALIDEDRLLSRIKTVESQLIVYTKNYSEDKVRNEILKLEEEKSQYQIAAKEALEKVHQEKLQVTEKLINLESRLNETEEECQSLHEIAKHAQLELQELAAKYSNAQKNLAQVEATLADKEQASSEMVEWAMQQKEDLTRKVNHHSEIGQVLHHKLDMNRLDSMKIHKKITGLKNYMQTLKDINAKLLSEESKDGVNPIEIINAILETLNGMIAETETIDISPDKLKSFTERESFMSRNMEDEYAKYIVPPSSRTTINGKNDDNHTEKSEMSEQDDDGTEVNYDSSSTTSEDTHSLVGSEESNEEKSVVEMKLVNDTSLTGERSEVTNKLEVKFADDNGKELVESYHHHYHNHHSNDNSAENDWSDSLSANDSAESIPATSPSTLMNSTIGAEDDFNSDNEKLPSNDDKEEVIEEKEKEETDGDYIKTLKPVVKTTCDCSSQPLHTREYILDLFMSSLDSLDNDDDAEAQQTVKKELDQVRSWFVNESSDLLIDKLKEFYYRAKNEKSRTQEINEQLVILKEKFNTCNEDKNDIAKQYATLKNQCGDYINTSYSVPIQYIAPILIALLWLLMEKMF